MLTYLLEKALLNFSYGFSKKMRKIFMIGWTKNIRHCFTIMKKIIAKYKSDYSCSKSSISKIFSIYRELLFAEGKQFQRMLFFYGLILVSFFDYVWPKPHYNTLSCFIHKSWVDFILSIYISDLTSRCFPERSRGNSFS